MSTVPIDVGTRTGTSSMIGVGVDVVAISSFAEQLNVAGSRFADAFTPLERTLGSPDTPLAERLAGRWAAKEAFIKAWSGALRGLPPVIAPEHVRFQQIEVTRDAWGRPGLRLHGDIAAAFARSTPGATAHLSMSHDGDTATAFVVLTASSATTPTPATDASVTEESP